MKLSRFVSLWGTFDFYMKTGYWYFVKDNGIGQDLNNILIVHFTSIGSPAAFTLDYSCVARILSVGGVRGCMGCVGMYGGMWNLVSKLGKPNSVTICITQDSISNRQKTF